MAGPARSAQGAGSAGAAAHYVPEIQYRLARKPLRGRPGQHRSRAPGPGLEVHAFAPLSSHPDARRLDLHASARDPFGHWIVRLPRQRSGATLAVLADLSASMSFGRAPAKQQVVADLVDALGHSAWRAGDAVSFAGAADTLPDHWVLAPTRRRGATAQLAQRLRAAALQGTGCGGMLLAAQRHGRGHDCLVFLVSDFHWPDALLDAVCAALASRDVVPVVLWSQDEFDGWPTRGLSELEDLETGERRTVLFGRPLADAMRRRGSQRRAQLRQRFLEQGWRTFFCQGPFDASALNAYFHGQDPAA
jgi:hypothetical protein